MKIRPNLFRAFKPYGAAVILALLVVKPIHAQTVTSYIATGRSQLANQTPQGLAAANTAFSAALAINPNNEEANALKAVTRIAVLEAQPQFQTALSNLGVTVVNPNIYQFEYQFTVDGSNRLVPGSNATTDVSLAYLKNTSLPEITAALGNLQKIYNKNFNISLSAAETATLGTYIDYGDINILKSMLGGLRAGLLLADSYNLSGSLRSLYDLSVANQLTLGNVLKQYTSLFNFSNSNQRPAARAAFEDAIDDYLTGSIYIRSERDSLDVRPYLFSIVQEDSQEANFRAEIGAYLLTLYRPYFADGVVVNLAKAITSNRSPRVLLAQLDNGGLFIRNTWRSPTLDGILPEGTQSMLNSKAEANDLLSSQSGTPIPFPALYSVYVSAKPYTFGTVTGGGIYDSNTVVVLTAKPKRGKKFVSWTQGRAIVGRTPTLRITVASNRNLVANFK